MSNTGSAHRRLLQQLTNPELLPSKPPNDAVQATKKAYSELISRITAMAVAAELRKLGLKGARPTEAGLDDKSGAERRMAGGIGAKRVDVTWSTEESGLLLAYSIKTINFKDGKSQNYQKNLTNRRNDLLFECITLHRRFPYAVLGGLFFLDEEASRDGTKKRRSTFENANDRLLLFDGRSDPSGRDEQFEHLHLALLGLNPSDGKPPFIHFYRVGKTDKAVTLDDVIQNSLDALVKRNADTHMLYSGRLVQISHKSASKPKDLNDLKAAVSKPKSIRKPTKGKQNDSDRT